MLHAKPGSRFAIVAALLLGACASQGLPVGGTPSRKPPVLVRVTPDTNALNVKARSVTFLFDKVVSERPVGAASLDEIVTISPSDGLPSVDWHRQSLVVHPHKAWRANTAYTVTILPGLTDLFSNPTKKAYQTTFSTGGQIPTGVIRGIVFDWVGYKVAGGARLQATIGTDTIFRYLATADSSGNFSLQYLPPGPLHLRMFLDDNKNGAQDRREKWDSIFVTLTDSARHDFYLFTHDSVGPSLATETTVADSMTVRVKFTQALSTTAPFDTSNLTLRMLTKDSAYVRIAGVYPAAQHDSIVGARKRFVTDSLLRADTSKAGIEKRIASDSAKARALRDSISSAQIASVRARADTTKHVPLAKPQRPQPLTDWVVELAAPLPDSSRMMLSAKGVTNLAGATRESSRFITFYKPKKDSTAAKPTVKRDSTAIKAGVKRDSTAIKLPVKRDSTAVKPPVTTPRPPAHQ